MIQVPKDAPSLGPSNDTLPRGEWTENKVAQATGLSNERFARATPARKRVIIAKDVLRWLATAKLVPAGLSGASLYLRIIPRGRAEVARTNWVPPLDDYEVTEHGGVVNGDSCVACGIGALVATAAERGACSLRGPNDYLWNEDEVPESIRSALSGLFDADQLDKIEWAFEGGVGLGAALTYGHLRGLSEEARTRCESFALRYPYKQARLVAIMNNIIDNKGQFVP